MNITSKGQVTIPKEIREKYGLNEGTKIEFVDERGEVKLVKKGARSRFDKVYGILKSESKEDVDTLIEELRGR